MNLWLDGPNRPRGYVHRFGAAACCNSAAETLKRATVVLMNSGDGLGMCLLLSSVASL